MSARLEEHAHSPHGVTHLIDFREDLVNTLKTCRGI
jgi:predicted small metal-binding protein